MNGGESGAGLSRRRLSPEFVAVGHLTFDRFGRATRLGGAALYTALTAHRLGLSVGILTSYADGFPLDLLPTAIEIVGVPSEHTTTFEHCLEGGVRKMRVTASAHPLGPRDVPEDWHDADIVMLAPVLDEVDPLVAVAFGAATIGAAAQGYLRRLDRGGLVVPQPWASADLILGRAQAVFLSLDDVGGDPGPATEWFQRVPIGVLTAGREGANLFVNGERYSVRPHRAQEIDATGAGDVFAAAFMIHYHSHGDPWQASAAAACAAALSVEGEGWSTIPDAATLQAALAVYEREA
jgi:sugar/nucleoside kinase (ribokinase family)